MTEPATYGPDEIEDQPTLPTGDQDDGADDVDQDDGADDVDQDAGGRDLDDLADYQAAGIGQDDDDQEADA